MADAIATLAAVDEVRRQISVTGPPYRDQG
jgi:hypothetical protein